MIAARMRRESGCSPWPDQCEGKWKALTLAFQKCEDHNSKTGNDRRVSFLQRAFRRLQLPAERKAIHHSKQLRTWRQGIPKLLRSQTMKIMRRVDRLWGNATQMQREAALHLKKRPRNHGLGRVSKTRMSVFHGWRNMPRKNEQSRRPSERELNNNTERKWSSSLDCLMYSRTLKNELMHLKNGQVPCRWICDMICTSFNRYICHKMLQMFSSSVFLFPEKLCELFIHLTRNKM